MKETAKQATRSASLAQDKKVENFKSIFDDLFDIAHQDALQKTSEEDKQILFL